MASVRGNISDDEYSYIGDKGDIGFIDLDNCKSVCSYNPAEESDVVHISVPFPLVEGKPQSGVVGETICDSVTVKNNTSEPLELWSVSIYDSKPENSFTISLLEPPNAKSDLEYIQNFIEAFTMDDRILSPNQALTIWLSCKPKEIGLHSAAVHFSVGDETIERLVFVLAEDKISRSLASSKPYSRSQKKKQNLVNVHSPDAAYVVGRRPSRGSNRGAGYRYYLDEYPIPHNIRDMVNNKQIPDAVYEGLTDKNYGSFFKTLLAMEEIKLEEDMRAYDMECVTMKRRGHHFLTLVVPGLAEKRPSLVNGDYIFVKLASANENEDLAYQGYIHRVEAEQIYLKFEQKFHNSHRDSDLYNVQFSYNRTGMRKLYQAVEAAECLDSNFLFPSKPSRRKLVQPAPLVPISCTLNEEQISAVEMILGRKGGFPYVIHGPPGTGKTMTLIAAILQIYTAKPNARVLVCAPSNSAADHILERLISQTSVQIQKNKIFRLNAFTRPFEDINPNFIEFCCVEDSIFKCPSRWHLMQFRIIISTYASSSLIYAEGIQRGHFSYFFLDEAGQASEPESMVPLSHLYSKDSVAVLAGDPMQLGPVVFSNDAEIYGLGTSYLERLFDCQLYGGEDKYFMTKLVRNYRTCEAILRLPSELFYNGELIPCKEANGSFTSLFEDLLLNKEFPLLFTGVQGFDEREGSNPSWFNRIEASKVVEMIRILIKEKGLEQDDIGVITPYRQQVCKIRGALENLGWSNIKVGSVEQFQGQERQVIIISTVRSTIKHNEFDKVHYLGFLSNPRRFNVAITRAKSLLVVIGNPHILCKDQHWNKILWYCVDNGSYKGCFLPERKDLTTEEPSMSEQMAYEKEDNWNDSGVQWGNGGGNSWNSSDAQWGNGGHNWNSSEVQCGNEGGDNWTSSEAQWGEQGDDWNSSEGQWVGGGDRWNSSEGQWGNEGDNSNLTEGHQWSNGGDNSNPSEGHQWGNEGNNLNPSEVHQWGNEGDNSNPSEGHQLGNEGVNSNPSEGHQLGNEGVNSNPSEGHQLGNEGVNSNPSEGHQLGNEGVNSNPSEGHQLGNEGVNSNPSEGHQWGNEGDNRNPSEGHQWGEEEGNWNSCGVQWGEEGNNKNSCDVQLRGGKKWNPSEVEQGEEEKRGSWGGSEDKWGSGNDDWNSEVKRGKEKHHYQPRNASRGKAGKKHFQPSGSRGRG